MSDNKALDDILHYIGFGKQQATGLFFISSLMIFYAATHITYLFSALDSEYRCFVPTCDDESEPNFESDWIRNAIPINEANKLKKCEMYKKISSDDNKNDNCSAAYFNTMETIRCSNHVFKDNEYFINREYNILCEENRWKLSLVGSINTIGMLFGSSISGFLADRYGRKIVLLLGMSLCASTGLLRIVSPTFALFCSVEFLDAMLTAGSFQTGYVLMAELVVPKYRPWIICIFCTCYSIGQMLVALVAWIWRDWRIFILIFQVKMCTEYSAPFGNNQGYVMIIYVFYVPAIFSICLYPFIPESIRWYSSKGRMEEATKTLKKFTNKKTIPRSYMHALHRSVLEQEEKNKTISVAELVKSRPLLLRWIYCCILWLNCLLVWYGLTMYSVAITTSPYLNVGLISLAEIVSNWCILPVLGIFRRKNCILGANLITSISCLGCIFAGSKFLRIALYCVGKFGSTINFVLIEMVTVEVFPTPLRQTTLTVCSMIGRFGSMISPQMALLGHIWESLPLLIFAIAPIFSGLLTSFLPETLNVKLPDTIEEAENLGKNPQEIEHNDN